VVQRDTTHHALSIFFSTKVVHPSHLSHDISFHHKLSVRLKRDYFGDEKTLYMGLLSPTTLTLFIKPTLHGYQQSVVKSIIEEKKKVKNSGDFLKAMFIKCRNMNREEAQEPEKQSGPLLPQLPSTNFIRKNIRMGTIKGAQIRREKVEQMWVGRVMTRHTRMENLPLPM
jgi:hypothetical protein